MPNYEVRIANSAGQTLDVIDGWLSLTYTRAVNDVGCLELALSGSYDTSFLYTDGRIFVYRDGNLEGETPWFIRKTIQRLDADGAESVTVYGYSAMELLRTRIAAYPAGASQVSKADYADNLMKAIVRDNMGSSASDTNRSLATYLSIESDASIGAFVQKSFSRDNVLEIIQEISQTSITAGSAVYFDVVAPAQTNLEFRTYLNLRGIDHTFPGGINPVVLSPERGNLVNVELSFDRSEEITFVYAGGTGQKDVRIIKTACSVERMGESPFNRRELFYDNTNISGSAILVYEAEAQLRAGRPVRTFSGELVNVPGSCEYGVHWNLGDRVTATYKGQAFNCTIDAVTVTVQGGREEINGTLRVEES